MDRERRLAALFDMDGVVLDTEGQYDNFWREQEDVTIRINRNFIR